ncbi:hypothetical protein DB347_20960 [Opitutaceae bacterium EW11]|nr:hypothetical protein DB347_20960 [Opitutaceae bacterium EW11]
MPEPAFAPTPEPPPEEFALAGVYSSERDGALHGLVVLAMGLPYWLEFSESGWKLLVEARYATAVGQQLALFDRESVGWPPLPPADSEAVAHRPVLGPLLWCLCLIGIYQLQLRSSAAIESLGLLDARRVFEHGEIWRPFTALFLHADIAHLTGNLVCGFFVLSSVQAAFGRARGWLFFFAAATAGNFLVAASSLFASHRSLGASTAVFGGLGLLTGRAVRSALGSVVSGRWRPVALPLGAGATLLGLFGAGEPQTDVLAHAAGFLCGVLLGLAARNP